MEVKQKTRRCQISWDMDFLKQIVIDGRKSPKMFNCKPENKKRP